MSTKKIFIIFFMFFRAVWAGDSPADAFNQSPVTESNGGVQRTTCEDLATDWNDLGYGDTYHVGDSFTTYGVSVSAYEFTWSDGTPTGSGYAAIQNSGMANGSLLEVMVNNINLDIDLGLPVAYIEVLFGEYGGNLNLDINGQFVNFENFHQIDGALIGGVRLAVTGGFGNDAGILTMTEEVNPIHHMTIGGQELWLDDICYAETAGDPDPDPAGDCEVIATQWEDLYLGDSYYVGDVFTSELVTVTGVPFVWGDGTSYSGGYTQVQNGGTANGSGLEMMVNNINLDIDLGGSVTYMEVLFGEYGGNLNIDVNGFFVNFENFQDIDGANLGGVDVWVAGGTGGDSGVLYLQAGPAAISSFTIGGQELWIDDICYDELTADPDPDPVGDCEVIATQWEDMTLGNTYYVGDVFNSELVTVTGHPFVWSSGTPTSSGDTEVQNSGMASGSGLEMMVNNINLELDFGGTVTYTEVYFGEYGGNLNLRINGSFINFENFQDIDGTTLGGVDIAVMGGNGNDAGVLFLSAGINDIHALGIGGQELWIDDICYDQLTADPDPDPVGDCEVIATQWEDMTLGNTYYVGDVFNSELVTVTGHPFVWSSGTPTSSGTTVVQNGGMANGSGLEMMVNNINLDIDFGGSVTYSEVYFGEYGGNLNLRINGAFINFDNFHDVDGTTLGGVNLLVTGGFGNDAGILYLLAGSDDIHSLVIGGQELWIDDICYDELTADPDPDPVGDCEVLATDWEDQPLGAVFTVGDIISTYAMAVEVQSFTLTDGTVYTIGSTTVADNGSSNGTGFRMIVNNVNLDLDLGGTVTYMEILFGEHGGNKNLSINGEFWNFEDFSVIDGQVIGGVLVTVIDGYGWDAGTLILTTVSDAIGQVSLGGQQFSVDDICYDELVPDPDPDPVGDCEVIATQWEDMTLGNAYYVGDVFNSELVTVTGLSFTWDSGTPTSSGTTVVQNGGMANGSGLEMMVNNINLDIDFGGSVTYSEVYFGEYGGNLNLRINGAFINFDNFHDVDGTTLGGVNLLVTGGFGNDAGILYLLAGSDDIHALVIGGQELWIDDICYDELTADPDPDPAGDCEAIATDWEDMTLGNMYNVADVFTTYAVTVTGTPFVWDSGTPTSSGYTEVQNGGMANGSGMEMMVNNITLDLDLGVTAAYMEVLFGEYGGNLNLEFNGDFRNFQDFQDLDGLVIGGVLITVLGGYGNDAGVMICQGVSDDFSSFRIGGQELWIDDICLDVEADQSMPGDMDGSGSLDIVDIVTVIGIIVGNLEADEGDLELADFNGDGNVDVVDIVQMIAEILSARGASGEALEEASLRIEDHSIHLDVSGEVAAIQMNTRGDYAVSSTGLPAGCSLYQGHSTMVIACLDGRSLSSGELFSFDGDLEILEGIAVDWNAGSVALDLECTPEQYLMMSAYPNPFNPTTTIQFELAADAVLRVDVFDVNGRLVENLAQGYHAAGSYSVSWNASQLSTGIFFARITTGQFSRTQKLILVK